MSDDIEPALPLSLPIQPTGSGVIDLEIEREQAAIADGEAEEAGDAGPVPFGDVTASGAE